MEMRCNLVDKIVPAHLQPFKFDERGAKVVSFMVASTHNGGAPPFLIQSIAELCKTQRVKKTNL